MAATLNSKSRPKLLITHGNGNIMRTSTLSGSVLDQDHAVLSGTCNTWPTYFHAGLQACFLLVDSASDKE